MNAYDRARQPLIDCGVNEIIDDLIDATFSNSENLGESFRAMIGADIYWTPLEVHLIVGKIDEEFIENFRGFGLFIQPQYEISGYRPDFRIVLRDDREPESALRTEILVECDGHDFHERTKFQAAYDRSKDRKIQSEGHKIFRFTGSEIWADPISCANEVIESLGLPDFGYETYVDEEMTS